MAEPFTNPRRPAHGPRHEALPHAALVHGYSLDVKPVDIHALTALRVRDRRAQRLAHERGGALRSKLQDVQRLLDPFAADLVNDQSHLAGGKPDKFGNGSRFHYAPAFGAAGAGALGAAAGCGAPGAAGAPAGTVSLASPFRSPEWIKKVRVGENSPR